MSFDDAFVLSDQAAFTEMASTVILSGLAVQGVISPISSYSTNSDGSGGFNRIEGQRVEILTDDLAAALNGGPLRTGMLVEIDSLDYRVMQIKVNGYTTTLILGSTAGTGAQF